MTDMISRFCLIRRTGILLLVLCAWAPRPANAHEPSAAESAHGGLALSSAKAFGHADLSFEGAAQPMPDDARPLSVQATEVTLSAVADTMVSSGEPTKNFGKAIGAAEKEGLLIGGDDRENHIVADYHGLLRFDVSAIPARAYILRSRLVVYHVAFYDYTSHPTRSIEVFPANSTWNETSVTWNTQPEPSASAACSIYIRSGADQSSFGLYECDLSTDAIHAWTSGETPNYGFVLSDSTSEAEKVFRGIGTREGGSTYIAKLIVSYTLDAPTATSTRMPTSTPRPTYTPSRTPTRTDTPTRTNTPRPTATPTNTATPRPPSLYVPFGLNGVSIPTNAPTASPRPSNTPLPTNTPGGEIVWRRRAAVSHGRSGMGVAADDRGSIFAVGGYISGNTPPYFDGTYQNTTEVYRPSDFSWSRAADNPVARDSIAVASVGRRIFAIGGLDGSFRFPSADASVQEYVANTDSWIARTALPLSLGASGAAAGTDGKVYVFGGISYSSDPLNPLGTRSHEHDSVYVYDPAADRWTQRAPMPRAITSPAVTSAPNGHIYVIDGTDVYEYTPAQDAWVILRSMPTSRRYLGIASGYNGRVYAVGGTSSDGKALATVEEYDPITDTWTRHPDMPTARASLALVVSGRSIFAVTGSSTDEGVLP